MGVHVTLTMRTGTFDNIIFMLEEYTTRQTEFECIKDTIETIQFLEEEYQKDMDKQNKKLKEWIEQQRLMDENNFKDVFGFLAVQSVLDNYNLNLDLETKTHLIFDLCNLIKEKAGEYK